MSKGLITVPISRTKEFKNNLGLINGMGKRKERSNMPPLDFAEPWGIFFDAGLIYYNDDELTSALDCFDTAIMLKKDFPEAWNNRGVCFLRIGHFQEAFRSINEALRLNPNYKIAIENKQIVLRELKNRNTINTTDSRDPIQTPNRP